MKPPVDESAFKAFQTHVLDADSEWWPFAFLRPEQHQHFSTGRCALLAVLYGAPTTLAAALIGKIMGDPLQVGHLLLLPLCVCGALFAAFRVGAAPSWNRRAARLRPLHERRTEWQRSLLD